MKAQSWGAARLALVAALFAVLPMMFMGTACAPRALVAPTPESPREALVTIEADYAALVRTATDLRRAGMIGDAQALRIEAVFTEMDQALDAADTALRLGEMETAEKQLALAAALLLRLRQEVHRGP